MARGLNGPFIQATLASTTATATSTADFVLPRDIHSGQFILDVTAASGTSPTLDIKIQTSPDGGTTYYDCFRFPQKTATAIERLVTGFFGDGTNTGTTGTNANSGNSATITATSTGALTTGVPINPDKMRVRYLIGGTNPSFTFKVFFLGRVLDAGRE